MPRKIPLTPAEQHAACAVAIMLRSMLNVNAGLLEEIALAECAAALPESYPKFSAALRRGALARLSLHEFASTYGRVAEAA